jgi:RNA polymerase sigma-70 factor (ECF subfamily)
MTEVAQEPLLPRIAAGEAEAVQECLDRFGGLVWSLAKRAGFPASEAEDAVQEIFVDIWKSAERFDASLGSEATFVATIARRRLIDRRRRRARSPSVDPLEVEPASPRSEEGLEAVAVRDEAQRARAALARLRPEQQRVLELSILHGLTHQEIAEQESMPLGTVKTHARRGLIKVRQLLAGEDEPS